MNKYKFLLIIFILKKFFLSFKNINKLFRIKKKFEKLKRKFNFIIPNYIYIYNSVNNYNIILKSEFIKKIFFIRLISIQLNCKIGKILTSLKINFQSKIYNILEYIIENYILSIQVKKFKFYQINVPILINYTNLLYSGQIPKFYNNLYKLEKKNIFLIPTSEVIMNSLSFFVKNNNFPINFVCNSLCFRNEHISYSKKNIGLLRQHQFKKIELFKFIKKKNSINYFYNIFTNLIYILNSFKIKFRILKINNKEINDNSFLSFDIEIFSSIDCQWIELSSISLCLDKPFNFILKKKKIHLINSSCFPIGRFIYVLMFYYRINNNFIKMPKSISKLITDLLKW